MAQVDAKFKELWRQMKGENEALKASAQRAAREHEQAMLKAKERLRAEQRRADAMSERADRVELRVESLEEETRRLREVLRQAQEQESLMRTIAKIREPERSGANAVGFDAVVKTIDRVSGEVNRRVTKKLQRRNQARMLK